MFKFGAVDFPWRLFLLALVSNLFLNTTALAEIQIPEMDKKSVAQFAKQLRLAKFKNKKFVRKIKVAVLDNGFGNYESEVGKGLPTGTIYHAGKASAADAIQEQPFHGVFMAMIVARVIRESGAEADYELHLFNTFGYTKFADAVETVTNENFDVVVYSQVWEYGGNGDGRGFINALVDKAVKAGVIWINASGPFGHLTRLAPVDSKVDGDKEWVVFKNKSGKTQQGAEILCKAKKGETCNLRVVLSWNDFKDDVSLGTDKDLDLVLVDDRGNVLYNLDALTPSISTRTQRSQITQEDQLASLIPRELVEFKVPQGTYKARVLVKSKNFSASQDTLRITASGFNIEMADASVGETILPPADNPGVIVIGAADDFQSGVSKKEGLPHVYLNSLIKLVKTKDNKNAPDPFSTSNAAAMAGGLAVLHLGTGVEKSKDTIIEKLKSLTRKPIKVPARTGQANRNEPNDGTIGPESRRENRNQISRNQAERRSNSRQLNSRNQAQIDGQPIMTPQGKCLPPARVPTVYPWLQSVVGKGGVPVRHGGRVVIATYYNYLAAFGIRADSPGQRPYITPQGPAMLTPGEVPRGAYEVVPSRAFRLPICR